MVGVCLNKDWPYRQGTSGTPVFGWAERATRSADSERPRCMRRGWIRLPGTVTGQACGL
jgi:hypothetical protein